MSKTVLFQAIQSRISTQFSSISPIDRTLSGTTTPSQSVLWSDGNEGVLSIPQSFSITGTSPPDCLESHPEHSWRGVDLPLCRKAVGVFYTPSRLGSRIFWAWGRNNGSVGIHNMLLITLLLVETPEKEIGTIKGFHRQIFKICDIKINPFRVIFFLSLLPM